MDDLSGGGYGGIDFGTIGPMRGIGGEEQRINLTLITDAYIIRGTVITRQRRVTDILNQAEQEFIVISDAVLDEFGTRSVAVKADYAQVNLAAVLFAVADAPVEPVPELRTPKIPELAMISIPPFKIVGRIHLMPERELRDALLELTGRFIPVTDAMYWSETVGEARKTAHLVAFNHSRAQILAPHREVDPWEGLQRGAVAEPPRDPWQEPAPEAEEYPEEPPWPEVDRRPGA
jgi:hypothetical protein